MDAALPAPRSLGAWWLAARPRTLPVAVAPVLVGGASVVGASARPLPWLAALFGAILIQIGTNFANDVFDFEKGTDNETRIGPTRAVQAGLISPAAMRRGMIVAFLAAAIFGLYLTWVAGWVVVAIGVASILSGIAYTGGPYPLGYHGLGDLFVFVFFGFVAVCGTAWVTSLSVPTSAWIASSGVGAIATAVLVVNNTRDAATDRLTGKRTLVVRFGRGFGVFLYALLFAIAIGAPLAIAALRVGSPWVLGAASLLLLPFAIRLTSTLAREHDGEILSRCLADTAKSLVLYAAVLSVGLVLS